jgi:hypothetical protein
MVKLRNTVMAVALGMSVTGCALTQSPTNIAHYSIWHCDECDDFPTPAYGPGFSMMPGSYTAPPAANMPAANPTTSGAPDLGAPPPQQRPALAPAAPAVTPPSPPAVGNPGLGANRGQPATGSVGSPDTVVTGAASNQPAVPAGMQNDLQVPVANR